MECGFSSEAVTRAATRTVPVGLVETSEERMPGGLQESALELLRKSELDGTGLSRRAWIRASPPERQR